MRAGRMLSVAAAFSLEAWNSCVQPAEISLLMFGGGA
jgi:hypothetical protein